MDTTNPRKRTALTSLVRLLCTGSLLLSVLLASLPVARAAVPSPDANGFEVVTLPPEALTAPIVFDAPTAGSPKLESALSEVAAAARTSKAGALQQAEAALMRLNAGRVQVLVTTSADRAGAATAAVQGAGGEVTARGNGDTWLQAWLPVTQLDALAQDASVDYLARPAEAVTTATTEGAAVINAPAWHSAGYKGAGAKVAIIDAGFKGYKNLLGSDLPASVTVKNFVDGESDAQADGTTEHGTACAEVVYDIAPNAQIYLGKVSTALDLQEAVNWAKAEGVKIITTSLVWYNGTPGDGTGFFADLVASARSAGIFWTTAAGNDRQNHWGGALNANADGWHLFANNQIVDFFGPGDGNLYNIPAGYSIRAYLRWDDWTAKTQDLDLFVVKWNPSTSTWQAVVKSENRQTGPSGLLPTEAVGVVTSGSSAPYGIAVKRYATTRNVNFELFVPKMPRLDKIVTARSLGNLADSPAAMTVAALDVKSPYPQESYSSEGPMNGPGGTATGGATKPDLAGFANVATISYPNNTFNGTSCATPHVAGAAALVKGANPSWTPAQVQSFLEGRAVDIGAAGKDTQFGWGRLYLGAPPNVNPPKMKKTYLPVITKPLPAPVLDAINNGGSGNYTVSWSPVNAATSYTLQEAVDPGFASASAVYTGAATSWQAASKAPGTYYYRVSAASPSATSGWSNLQSATVQSAVSWTTILADNFEGSFPGNWKLAKVGAHGWGRSNCRASSGSYSAWAVGGNGLTCGSNYPDNNVSWLVYGPFSLNGATAAEVRYQLWANTQRDADYLCTMASLDGNSFYGDCGSGNSNGWISQTFDFSDVYQLGDLRGQSQVWMAFNFETDGSVNYTEGIHVDDVVLRKCTTGACPAGAPSALGPGIGLRLTPAHRTLP